MENAIRTLTVRTPGDLVAAIPAIVGFHPTESIVVAPFSPGPTARVDLAPDVTESVATFGVCQEHWSGPAGVGVVVFSDRREALACVTQAFEDLLPQVSVKVALRTADSLWFDEDGESGPVPDPNPELATTPVASCRDDLVEEAETTNASAQALTSAEAAYRRGDGARAWVYLDRFHQLAAHDTPRDDQTARAEELADKLTNCVNPDTP